MSRKGESITLSLSAADKEALEIIAYQYGCVWGEKPNLSELNRKIANGELKVCSPTASLLSSQQAKGKKAIASIIRGLTELSLIWFD